MYMFQLTDGHEFEVLSQDERGGWGAGAPLPQHEPEGLVLFGRALLEAGYITEALEAFAAAGQELSPDDLVAVGQKCVAKGWLKEAREAFAAAGSKDDLVALGQRCVEKGWLKEAREAFKAVDTLGHG
jgi:hypothetical protein